MASWLVLLMLGVSTASAYDVVPKMAWWYDARFGMFIHFGSYSYYGHGEWAFSNEHWSKTNYQTQISANFNPTNFNAATIVGYAKAAGMKYIVITAKHHEGFAMWRSQVPSFTDVSGTNLYNLYNYTACKRDLLMELKNECDAQGIKFCLYYSILDWNHPSQTIKTGSPVYSTMSSFSARTNYINDMKAQLAELITNYNPAVLWFDGDWCANPASPTLSDWWIQSDATNLYSYLISLKPDLIINERVKRSLGLGDFECPEQTVPSAALARPFEVNATMNGVWGYNSNSENSYRSPTTILHEMVQVLSRDGNYLLNIGPKGDGSVTSGATNILTAFATWMSTYGDSVHGTTISPYGSSEPSWGYYTKKPGKLYAHVFTWPGGGQLQVPLLTNSINRIYMLNDTNTSLSYASSSSNITITVPATAPNAMDSVVVIDVAGIPTSTVVPLTPTTSGGTATASSDNASHGEGAAQAFDGSTGTKWFNNNGGTNGWLQYQYASGVAWAVIQYKIASANDVPGRDPKSWQFQGSTNGTNWVTLDTQTGQAFAARYQFNTYNLANIVAFPYYRLNITTNNGDAAGIQLSELQLYAGNPGPQGLTATAGGAQVNLTWASLGGASSYNVKRSRTSGSNYITIASLSATNYPDTTVVNGNSYYYVVSATNSVGESPNSAEVNVRPVSTAPTSLGFALNSSQLKLSWPIDHTGLLLQAQTNSLASGLGTNWVTVSSSSATNQVSVPINQTNGSVFFRLISP